MFVFKFRCLLLKFDRSSIGESPCGEWVAGDDGDDPLWIKMGMRTVDRTVCSNNGISENVQVKGFAFGHWIVLHFPFYTTNSIVCTTDLNSQWNNDFSFPNESVRHQ